MKILTVNNKKEEKFLRTKVDDFDFGKSDKKKIEKLVKAMRKTMAEAKGVGLSANQVGLSVRMFTMEIPDKLKKQDKNGKMLSQKQISGKFYAIFNPEIIKSSKKKIVVEEGCLSIPGIYGLVERPEKITLAGQDRNGKKIKIQAAGLLARVFQHETDHLNGVLFIDKATDLKKWLINDTE
ncbi:MAG TPA: peptide deformylase [Candidatus Campbellbacteria bacterium]|nr:peptide deformylase [Candidatus Campbellbacteria bacterium]